MVTITDSKSLEKWLEDRKPQVAVAIAVRVALRVLPLISENWRGRKQIHHPTFIVLPVLHASLASRVAILATTRQTKNIAAGAAAEAAEDVRIARAPDDGFTAARATAAVYSGARAAARGGAANAEDAAEAAEAADSAFGNFVGTTFDEDGTAATAAFWRAVSSDCTILNEDKDVASVVNLSLWYGTEELEEIARAWQRLQAFFNTDGAVWGFWRDWYQKVLDGQYQNPDLLYDIAVLPDSDWKAGPVVIAEKIAGLQAKYLAPRTPLAEVLHARQETSLIYAVPVPINREQLYATGLQRMKDAFADAQANNEIGSGSQEARLIRRALYDYAADPQYVHDNLVQARRLIEEQIAKEFLPENGTANNYADTSRTFETDIRAWHPQVEEAVIARGRIRLTEVDPRDLIVVADLRLPVLILLESDLAKQTGDDINDVIDVTPLTDGTVPPRSIETLYRLASRSVRIYKILGDEAIYAGKVGAASAALAAAIRYFAGLFGI